MTPAALAELRALLAAATPATGPWKMGRLASYHGDTGTPFRCIYRGEGETPDTRIFVNGGEGEHGAVFNADADAALIVALVNAAPELIALAARTVEGAAA